MLYSLYDARSQALAPVRLMAEATRLTFINPLQPLSYTPFGRMMAAGSQVLEGLIAERGKPAWNIDTVESGGKRYPVAIETTIEKPFGDLVHFRKVGGPKGQPRILLVAPMSGHHATLLRDTVRALLKDHEVWITDWRDAALIPKEEGRFGLDSYIGYLIDFASHLGADGRAFHMMAVCQPAPAVLAACAIMAEEDADYRPKSMILMGGPVDTRASSTIVTQAAENRAMSWFEGNLVHRVPARFPGANRKVYPGFLQLRAFWAMNPGRHASAHWSVFQHLSRGDGESAERHQAFYDEYMSVMDTPADFYLETVDHVFKRHSIAKGEYIWRGRPVDGAAIRDIALMTVEGELDDISSPAQTEAAHDICANIPDELRDHWLQLGVGHYGIFNGRRWRECICPRIGNFVRRIEGRRERLSNVA